MNAGEYKSILKTWTIEKLLTKKQEMDEDPECNLELYCYIVETINEKLGDE